MDSWRRRSNDLISTIDDIRRRTAHSCGERARDLLDTAPSAWWTEGLYAVEEIGKCGLKAQADLGSALLDHAGTLPHIPDEMAGFLDRIQQLVQDVTLTEASLIANGCDLARHLNPARLPHSVRVASRSPMRRMRQISKDAIEQQLDFLRGWSGAGAETATPPSEAEPKQTER